MIGQEIGICLREMLCAAYIIMACRQAEWSLADGPVGRSEKNLQSGAAVKKHLPEYWALYREPFSLALSFVCAIIILLLTTGTVFAEEQTIDFSKGATYTTTVDDITVTITTDKAEYEAEVAALNALIGAEEE